MWTFLSCHPSVYMLNTIDIESTLHCTPLRKNHVLLVNTKES